MHANPTTPDPVSDGDPGATAPTGLGPHATTATATASLQALPPDRYLSIMQASPSILELTRNPFVLRLFVEALPGILSSGLPVERITRYDIYSGFVAQWFTREVRRLPPDHQSALGVAVGDGGRGEAAVVALFDLLCALLAGEMLKASVLTVSFTEEGEGAGPGGVWYGVQDTAGQWLVQDDVVVAEATARFRKLPPLKQRQYPGGLDAFVRQALDARVAFVLRTIEAFATTCPLRKLGHSLQFIHKSFWEYFCARLVLLTAGSGDPSHSLDVRVARTLTSLAIPGRRIQSEPEVNGNGVVTLPRWCRLGVVLLKLRPSCSHGSTHSCGVCQAY